MMPSASWFCSMAAAAMRVTPIHSSPDHRLLLAVGVEELHFMGAEYLVPRKNTCPTSMPR